MKFLIPFAILLILSSSCNKKKAKEQAKADDTIILQYIADHNLNAIKTASGLYYVIDTQGLGAQPTSNTQVKVAYKGYLTDGTKFDESTTGVIFKLSEVIVGWTEGITYFKEGGSGKLLIPSALGYAGQEKPGIPANSVTIFDINLLQVY